MTQARPAFSDLVTAAIARDHSLVPIQTGERATEVDHLSGLGANFLAHLIATRDKAPQTRTIRRASQDEAIESYSHSVATEDDVVAIRQS
jgi:hypothetical protein